MFAEERVATAAHPENQGVGNVAGMEVEIVGRAVVGFEHSKVFGAEVRVRFLAGKDRKEKRQVGVVRVQQIQLAEVERIIARHRGEVSVQLVVSFHKQIAVRGRNISFPIPFRSIEYASRPASTAGIPGGAPSAWFTGRCR